MVVFQIFLAARSVTINVRMSIASSARFASNYVKGGDFFRSEDVRGTRGRTFHDSTFARRSGGVVAQLGLTALSYDLLSSFQKPQGK
jgi:hypothetical protein